MKTVTKPYKVHPYKVLVARKCSWIEDVRRRVEARISEFEKFIENQSKMDGQPEMLDEKHLYESFKYNEAHNQYYGNLIVLKYFTWKFKVKILYEMIGVWKFTERDVEMYNYFRTTESFNGMKEAVISTKLRPIDGEAPNIYAHDDTCNWIVHVGKEDEFYSNFFYQEIVLLNDIVRNLKGNPLIMPERSFFDGGHLHEGLNLSEPMDFEDYKDVTV